MNDWLINVAAIMILIGAALIIAALAAPVVFAIGRTATRRAVRHIRTRRQRWPRSSNY